MTSGQFANEIINHTENYNAKAEKSSKLKIKGVLIFTGRISI